MKKQIISPQFNNYPPHSYFTDVQHPIQFEKKDRKECINYIHLPYCNERCGYCILSSVIRDSKGLDNEIKLKKQEINLYSEHVKDREVIAALWGGGTPSILLPEQVVDLYGHAQKKFNFSKNAEITVEMKPNTINPENIEAFKSCGMNRISFGVQTLNKLEMKYCNRQNSPEIMYDAINLATKHGIDNINLDLLIGLPTQTVSSFRETCEKVFSTLTPNHTSLYILIVHPKTYFARLQEKQPYIFADADTIQKMYDVFFETAQKHNYVATSPLNVAKKTSLRSKYQYYNWKGYERIAIGPESIGYCGETQYINYSWSDNEYNKCINSGKFPIKSSCNLSKEQSIRRKIILGLQNLEIDINELNSAFNLDIMKKFDHIWDSLIKSNLIEISGDKILVTVYGRKYVYYIQTMFYEKEIGFSQKGVAGVKIKKIDHLDNPIDIVE